MAAEGAGQPDAVDLIDAELVHQQPRAGVERRLGKLDRPDIGLQDADFRIAGAIAFRQHIGPGPPILDNAIRFHRQRSVDHALRADDAGKIHLADRLNDTGAANAGDAERRRRF